LVLGAVLPIYTRDNGRVGVQPRYSLMHVYGVHVLLQVAVPLLVCSTVFGLLRVAEAGHYTGKWAAWALSAALLAGAVIGAVTYLVGIFVVPSGLLAVLSCAVAAPTGQQPGNGEPPVPA
jgi:hypothetical protein